MSNDKTLSRFSLSLLSLRFSDKDRLESEVVLYTRKAKNPNLTSRKVPTPMCRQGVELKGKLFGERWSVYPHFLEKKLRKLGQRTWGYHNLRHRYASHLVRRASTFTGLWHFWDTMTSSRKNAVGWHTYCISPICEFHTGLESLISHLHPLVNGGFQSLKSMETGSRTGCRGD